MRILYTTTIGMTMIFFRQMVKRLTDDGHTVDIATNEDSFPVDGYYRNLGCVIYNLPWSRSPVDKANFNAVKKLKGIAANYDIIHCHTPVAAACTRLACKKLRKNGLKVFYTAHGFHFYKGAPLQNWLVYYPVEWYFSFHTDTLITINNEDYEFSKKHLHAGNNEYIPGVGIDINKFSKVETDKKSKRREIGVPQDCFLLLSVGELNKNKNHQVVIKALAKIKKNDIHYVIAGEGELDKDLKALAEESGLKDRVHLLGFRNDVSEIYSAADVNLFPSIREGLGLAAVEGMAAGLPLICGDNRGTRCYAEDGVNALICPNNSADEYAENILRVYNDRDLIAKLSKNTMDTAKRFSFEIVNQKMIDLVYGKGNEA